jgi:uncharacterized damage-inducible protein DinB
MTAEETDLRYPIGRARRAESFTPDERQAAIEGIRQLPQRLRAAVSDLSEEQLATPYRPGGWTVRQLVHHVADSHINAYTRVRLGLTEEWPLICNYQETLWAKLADAQDGPLRPSLDLLDALHVRWVHLLQSLEEKDWKRGYTHPENGRYPIEQVAILYDWHGRHHTAHVTQLRARMGW